MWGWGWVARYLGVGLFPSWFGTSIHSSHLSSFPLLRRPGGGGEGGAGGGGREGFVSPFLRYFLIVFCCWRVCFLFL